MRDKRMTLWVDVTSLVSWRGNTTGIARALGQMVRHWQADAALPVRLCRYDGPSRAYLPAELPPQPAARPPAQERPCPVYAPPLERVVGRLPDNLCEGAVHFYQGAKCAGRLVRAVYRRGVRVGQNIARRFRKPPPTPFAPGDVLFIAGTSWVDGPPAEVLAGLRRSPLGLRVVHNVYDVTPLRCPHLCPGQFTRAFARWLPGVLRESDLLLTNADHTRRDLEAYCRDQGLTCPPLGLLRWGDELADDVTEQPVTELSRRFPGPFALFVSTLSLHKNQELLLNVWRRLLEAHGSGVPTLVLVGGRGHRADAILGGLARDERLRRHVAYLPSVGDGALRWLYRHCLFTLFPSHYEGWGLPVAESLAHGKYCISSSAASLPEVGGDLADYHDPLDGVTCQRLIERALFEPAWLAEREKRIRREHVPLPWRDCARRAYALIEAHLFGAADTEVRAAA